MVNRYGSFPPVADTLIDPSCTLQLDALLTVPRLMIGPDTPQSTGSGSLPQFQTMRPTINHANAFFIRKTAQVRNYGPATVVMVAHPTKNDNKGLKFSVSRKVGYEEDRATKRNAIRTAFRRPEACVAIRHLVRRRSDGFHV